MVKCTFKDCSDVKGKIDCSPGICGSSFTINSEVYGNQQIFETIKSLSGNIDSSDTMSLVINVSCKVFIY